MRLFGRGAVLVLLSNFVWAGPRARPLLFASYLRRQMIKTLPFLLIISLMIGCGGYKMEVVKNELATGQPEKAYDHLQKDAPEKPDLPFLYELGLTAHYADRFTESNKALADAEIVSDELYTISITKEFIARSVTSQLRPYPGVHYERVLSHYYRALNYFYLDQLKSSLVECRRATRFIPIYMDENDNYKTFGSAFLAYLSGTLFEAQGNVAYMVGASLEAQREWNNAFISYRQAELHYRHGKEKTNIPMPKDLGYSLVRLARKLGFTEELTRYQRQYGTPPAHPKDYGELILFYESGYVPEIGEVTLTFPILKSDPIAKGKHDESAKEAFIPTLLGREGKSYSTVELEYIVHVAMPTIGSNRPQYRGIKVVVGNEPANGVLVEDVEKIAIATLDAGRVAMLFETLLRGLAKYLVSREAGKQHEALGTIANLAGVLTERADMRSWRTLPNQIFMVRMLLPAGTHTLKLSFLDANGQVRGSQSVPGIKIDANRITFLNHRTYE